MTVYSRYLLTVAVVLPISTVVLAAYSVQQLDAYLSLYVLEYLVISVLFAYVHPRGKRVLDGVGIVLFMGFLAIVAVKVADILRRPAP